MDNNPDLPQGWSMPDDLARRINDLINKRLITQEDDLHDALDEMAREIALFEPNPVDWG